jgi:PAS domain-containing protein
MSQPLELILARNLISNIVMPALLLDAEGSVALFNVAAGVLLGQHFEETGRLSAQEWTQEFRPTDPEGRPLSPDDLPLVDEVESARPAQGRFCFRSAQDNEVEVDVTVVPLVGPEGVQGAMVFLSPVGEAIPASVMERVRDGGSE